MAVRIEIGINDLATTHPVLAAEWHPTKNGDLTPQDVTSGSGKTVWWLGTCEHEWLSRIGHRNNGSGCHHCANIVSKAENQIKKTLEDLGLIVEGSNRTILRGKEIDIWLPEHKIGIEFNGVYWHSEKFAGINSHREKWLAAQKAGIQLIQIWEDDWASNSELIMKTLACKLDVSKTSQGDSKVTKISEKRVKDFLNKNHLRGFESGSYYIGIVGGANAENLQAVMALGNINSVQNFEIIRYASIGNIFADFRRLLTYVTNEYHPESLTVIADHCESDDQLYVTNGFIAEKELPPDYMYVIRTERKHKSKYPLERFRDDPALEWEKGLTEMELADLNGLTRIWDAGKTCYRFVL